MLGVEGGGGGGGGGGGSTQRSASCDSWMDMSSLIEIDQALLLSSSPDIATDIILGKRDPASVLPRPVTASPAPAPPSDPQDPQEPQSTSVSLSFPSVSDGAEELLESEEGAGSLPSEVESSDNVDDTPRSKGRTGAGQRGYRGGVFEAPQRDSGRSSSHSDYLDDYLEQLTRRCSSGLLGLEATAALRPAPPQQMHSSLPNPVPAPLPAPSAPPEPRHGQEEHRSASVASERREKRGGTGRARRWSAGQPLDPSRSVGSKVPGHPAGPDDPADLTPASPAPSTPPPPSPPSSSSSSSSFPSHQEYLDSYLGHLTDDAWLQFPSRLSSRRLIYLSSSDYFASVRKLSTSPSSSSASCPSTSHNGTGSGQDGAQSTDAPSHTPVLPRDAPVEPQSAPVTPSDKAKISSDEGIELMSSPVTPRSPTGKSEVPQSPPVPQDEPEGVPVPQFIVGGPVGRGTAGADEGAESSSEDSSETEPSTIVYNDDFIGEVRPAAPAQTAPPDAPRVLEEPPHTSHARN
ncbi:polycystic kidney disease protein 1-like 3 isoform X1 [Portunus trituberculatus]|uniref:polycystic kidney disease protein 1-like 3 isoform X1 n=1 Tax=Portunus trituberculatus TaxID=210409 RepID=UPI001E1CC8F5|nr:polycystic kidney disease protein 1-like 3 isoform X1 [Portunus trituberculatus]XP_045107458.1 polycystic kidney disease protein 1-like 3 isoform X1 [Portunus trituberculatus]